MVLYRPLPNLHAGISGRNIVNEWHGEPKLTEVSRFEELDDDEDIGTAMEQSPFRAAAMGDLDTDMDGAVPEYSVHTMDSDMVMDVE